MNTMINEDKNKKAKYRVVVVDDGQKQTSLENPLDKHDETGDELEYDKCFFGLVDVLQATRIIGLTYLSICVLFLIFELGQYLTNDPIENDPEYLLVVNSTANKVSKNAIDFYCSVKLSRFNPWKMTPFTTNIIIEMTLLLSTFMHWSLVMATYARSFGKNTAFQRKIVNLWWWYMLIPTAVMYYCLPDILPCALPRSCIDYFYYIPILCLFINVINVYVLVVVNHFQINLCDI